MRALLRRAPLAIAAGNLVRAEAALREGLAVQATADAGGPEAAETRLALADVLDSLARRDEAATLRRDVLAAMAVRYGADSAVVQRVRLAGLAALQDQGQLKNADTGVGGCEARASEAPDLLLACLTAQARNHLAAGRTSAAEAVAAKVVSEAEVRWGRESAAVVGSLLLQAEAGAAAGKPAAVLLALERANRLAGTDPAGKAWLTYARGRLLGLAGDPKGGDTALREALVAGTRLQSADLVASVTSTLASRLIASGKGQHAIDLWGSSMPQFLNSPLRRITALDGLGAAAASLGRHADAARFYAEASVLSQRTEGAGSPRFCQLVAAQATALSRAGDRKAANLALGLLKADPSHAAAVVRAATLSRLATEAGELAEALIHAKQALQQANAAFGSGSVAASFARLELVVTQVLANERPGSQDVEGAVATIRGQDTSWRAVYITERVRGLVAADAGQFDIADTAFVLTEALIAEHEGPASQGVALERANRGAVRLARGDAAGGDLLFRQALTMAQASGQARDLVWARIAVGAAAAARTLGDAPRAAGLIRDAERILPRALAVRQRWL